MQAHGIHKEGEVVHVAFPLETTESKLTSSALLARRTM